MKMAQKRQCGDWIESGRLGCGSFGLVLLWENKRTKQRIAVKICRNTQLSEKNRERWIQEVKILNERINHPNVIKALPLPKDIESFVTGHSPALALPALCMEYCEGGDLRKTLSTAENCCGLKETTILKVCGHIASAIQYLHTQGITHRDLKPENIVLSGTENRVVCKVIDLGYAKQLDPSSSVDSVVGTHCYLAPEILTGKKYSMTVDYWSYGCLMFECCTGNRPFPVVRDLFNRIGSKAPKHIFASTENDEEGMLTFSEALPKENRLNSVVRPKFEKLFRLLLDGCPRRRGGKVNSNGTREWVECVQEILAKNVIDVFCIDSGRRYTYELSPNFSMLDLTARIHNDTGIAAGQLELFQEYGSDLDSVSSLKPNMTVYIFNKAFKYEERKNCVFQLPTTVLEMLQNTDGFSECSMKWHVEAYKHSVFFIQKQADSNCCHIRGLKALVIRLLNKYGHFFTSKHDVLRQKVEKLKSNIDFFKLSLEFDLKKYESFCAKNGVCQELWRSVVDSWKRMDEELDENEVLKDADTIFSQKASLQSKITTMKKNDRVSQTPQRSKNQLVKRVEEVRAKYEHMKKLEREKSSCWKEKIEDLRNFIQTCLEEKKKINNEFSQFLSDLVLLRQQLEEFIPTLKFFDDDVMQLSRKVTHMQEKRQDQIWKLLCNPLKDRREEETHVETKRTQFRRSPSRNLIHQSQSLVARVKETLQTVKEQRETFQLQSERLDWTFCNLTDSQAPEKPP